MQDLRRDGLITAIGVASFHPGRPADLIAHNQITPAVNQIETHPSVQRHAGQQLMRARGVQIESWAPFAEGTSNLFSDPALTAIGGAHGNSVAQVVLRWLTRREVAVIPTPVRPERMAENLDIFGFHLGGQMRQIATLDTGASLFFDHRDPAMISWLNSRAGRAPPAPADPRRRRHSARPGARRPAGPGAPERAPRHAERAPPRRAASAAAPRPILEQRRSAGHGAGILLPPGGRQRVAADRGHLSGRVLHPRSQNKTIRARRPRVNRDHHSRRAGDAPACQARDAGRSQRPG